MQESTEKVANVVSVLKCGGKYTKCMKFHSTDIITNNLYV